MQQHLFSFSCKFLFTIVSLFIFNHICLADIKVTDDDDQVITLKSPASRVISLSPGMTELLFAAGGGDMIKGVVSYSDYPEAAKSITQIGSYNSLDLERILLLAPDLIIAWKSGNPPLQISKLKKLGLTVYTSEPRNFSDIPSTLKRLGKLLNTEVIAKNSAALFTKKLNEIEKKYTGKFPKKTVFIQIWNKPMMSINGEHLISRIIKKCNGENIFFSYPQLTITPNIETILSKNPEYIIATRQGDIGKNWLKQWEQWSFLKAVKNNHLLTANPDNLVRHTPRILDGMAEVCAKLNKEHL